MDIIEENDFFYFWKEGEIICYAFKKREINLEIAKMGVAIRDSISKGRPCFVYMDLTHVKSATKEARDYYGDFEIDGPVKAVAVFTPSFLTKIMGSFFINFTRPKVPCKIFSTKESALHWLNGFPV